MRNFIKIINESIENVDSRMVAQRVYDELDWSSGDGDHCLSVYAREHGIDLDDDIEFGEIENHVDRKSPEFRDWFVGWVEELYGDAEYEILSNVRDHKITLWRCIMAPKNWTPEGRHPGIYWSYDRHAAEAHWAAAGENFVTWTMQATVPIEGIDWETTLVMNGQPAYQDEKEVRLLDDYPVVVEHYWSTDD